jgi:tRNA uridine 5-carboxymethylaminomethyl modification enzyme
MEAGRFMRHTDVDMDSGETKLEPAQNALADSIRRFGFPVGRLRTGTPPRLSLKTINFDGLET